MGGKSSAPTPTDPKETAAASTSTNVGTSIANAFMNNVNQVTDDGTLTYDQSGSYTWNDPYTGNSYDIPTFTATQTLSDAQKAIKTEEDGASLNLATLANKQSNFLNEYTDDTFSYDTGEHETWAMNLYDQQNSDKNAQDSEALRTRLSNQGIQAGSEAYDREMKSLYDSTGSSRNNFLLNSYQTGFQSAQASRNQPINEITALMSGSQVSQPNFTATPSYNIATTDTAGIINNSYNQQMGAYQSQQAQQNAILGGLFGMGSSAIMASDKRVKKNIKPVGELKGHKLYEYDYKGKFADGKKHIGVMAQEVEKKQPGAVLRGSDGFRRVDYGALFGTNEAAA